MAFVPKNNQILFKHTPWDPNMKLCMLCDYDWLRWNDAVIIQSNKKRGVACNDFIC